MSLFHALAQRSTRRDTPFLHWEIERPLTTEASHEVVCAFIPDRPWGDVDRGVGSKYSRGTVHRCVIGRDNVAEFPALSNMIDELLSRRTFETVGDMLGQKIDDAYLNVQLICDTELLAPAVERSDSEALMTALLLVNPESETKRFSVHRRDGSHEADSSSPAANSVGFLFVPAAGLWQALDLEKRSNGCFSVLVSYVARETDWKLPARSLAKAA